ncbi:hypothetical protein ACN28S_53375 [Cystobacter fuscus]
MSDIIDPKGSVPVTPRSDVFVDQTRGQELEGSRCVPPPSPSTMDPC